MVYKQLTPQEIKEACSQRSTYSIVQKKEQKNLACLYGGEALFPFIAKLSPHEDGTKQAFRAINTVDGYSSIVNEIISTYLEGIYKKNNVSRISGDASLDFYFSNNYDNYFMNEIALMSLLLPECAIYLCRPSYDGVIVTEQDKIDAKAWSYPHVVKGGHLLNYEFNEDGSLEWISRKYHKKYMDETGTVHTDVKYLSRDVRDTIIEIVDAYYIYLCNTAGQLMDVQPHGFVRTDENGEVFPCVPVVFKRFKINHAQHEMSHGQSFMQPVCDKAVFGLNRLAQLVDMLIFSAHNVLVIDDRTFESIISHGGKGNAAPITIPTKDYDPKGIAPIDPHYLELPSTPVDTLKDLVYEKIPAEIRKAARVVDRSTTISQSGISKVLDLVPELAALQMIAGYLQSIDYELCNIIATTYLGNAEDLNVLYPTSFDLDSPTDMLARAQAFTALFATGKVTSPTGIKTLIKQAFGAALPDVDAKTMAIIYKEIDESGMETEVEPPETPEEEKAESPEEEKTEMENETENPDDTSNNNSLPE